jgi:hypothetical protein
MTEEKQQFINELNKEIIITHTITASRLLKIGEKNKAGIDGFLLYNFYCWVASWQLTNKIKATDGFCMRGLKMGRKKFRDAKNLLLKEGIIKHKIFHEKGRIRGHYIYIHFLNGFTRGTKNHTVVLQPSEKQATNTINKKINALDKKEIFTAPSAAEPAAKPKERKDQDIFDLIELFKPINPTYERLFANKSQRAALERLLKKLGREELEQIIKALPQTNKMQFAPVITTPYVLEMKLGNLIAFIQKEQLRFANKKIISI